MKTTAQLRTALKSAPLTSFSGTLYRVVDAQVLFGFGKGSGYVPRPLYNLGPPRSGARFTPKNGAPAVYLAGDILTAHQERLGVAGKRLLKPPPTQGALVTYVVNVQLHAVLDVTKPIIQGLLGTDDMELASSWRYRKDRKQPPTQRLGRTVAAAGGIEAIRYKSTKGPGVCYVVLTDTLKAPSFIEVYDPASTLMERIPAP